MEEFVGRLPIITTLSQLSKSDLLRVLRDVRGSLVSQYETLFRNFDVELWFTTLALLEICTQAATRGVGARGLRGIMVYSYPVITHFGVLVNWLLQENVLLDTMFEVP